MSAAIPNLSNQARTGIRINSWTRRDGSPVAPNQSEFDRITQNPRYRHFVRIPARIVRCLDYFQVRGDRIAAARILGAYYIFIAVVDNAIDSGEAHAAAVVFEHLATPARANQSELSDVALTTEYLKCHLANEVRITFRNQLGLLHETVREERSAVSIEAYVEVRKAVGRLTADLSYVLISPLLDGEEQPLRSFMQQVGAVGCLIDSVIDLSADRRRGLVSFKPAGRDYIKLTLVTLREGLAIGLRHPRLAGLFALAILDSVRDRFISTSESTNGDHGQVVS